MRTLKENAMSVSPEIIAAPDKEYEIVEGHPEEKEMGGARHSGVGVRLIANLWLHVDAHRLGGVYGPDVTFKIGDTSDCRMLRSSPLRVSGRKANPRAFGR